VILDLNMPVMDGLQFLTLLKRSYPGLQVIILTGRASPESRDYCLQKGAALFLSKLDIADGFEKIYAALESVASAPVEGFRGMLRQVGLPDVLQMECLGRKASVLEVVARDGGGRIFIEDGEIVHAEYGPLQGEPALFQLLGLTGGEFHLRPFTRPARPTIDGHWESLLMEAARLRDEAAGAAAEVAAAIPVPEQPPVPAAPPEAPPAAAAERVVKEIVLCSGSGELLYEWQAEEVERRVRLLQALTARAASFGRMVPVGLADRLEIETSDGRIVAVLQAERKIFVRVKVK
jgi:CheY-like chemotaxis protein